MNSLPPYPRQEVEKAAAHQFKESDFICLSLLLIQSVVFVTDLYGNSSTL